MSSRPKTPALGYVRTSSATNIGADKDSEARQRTTIEAFAARAGYEIVQWFNDPAVSGSNELLDRPGFRALLDRIATNGVKVVLVEDASRFARKLMIQESGIALIASQKARVLTANGDDLTDSDDEMRVALRQMMGVFAQLERARLVKKLRVARQRKKALTGKCGGRRNHQELRPEVVTLARELRGRRLTLREVSDQLAAAGHVTRGGKPFGPEAVKRMTGTA